MRWQDEKWFNAMVFNSELMNRSMYLKEWCKVFTIFSFLVLITKTDSFAAYTFCHSITVDIIKFAINSGFWRNWKKQILWKLFDSEILSLQLQGPQSTT